MTENQEEREGNDAYTTALFEKLESSDGQIGGKDIEGILISITKVVFEETSAFNEEESWWWNAEVQQTVKMKI